MKACTRVYLEAYTSILMIQKERLVRKFIESKCSLLLKSLRKEAYYGKELILADRDMVETQSDDILRDADKEDVALLIVGDPLGYVITERFGSSF